jgi:hypothetical protein
MAWAENIFSPLRKGIGVPFSFLNCASLRFYCVLLPHSAHLLAVNAHEMLTVYLHGRMDRIARDFDQVRREVLLGP